MNQCMNKAFIERFNVNYCTPKALYNHVGNSLLKGVSIHMEDAIQCVHHTPAIGGAYSKDGYY